MARSVTTVVTSAPSSLRSSAADSSRSLLELMTRSKPFSAKTARDYIRYRWKLQLQPQVVLPLGCLSCYSQDAGGERRKTAGSELFLQISHYATRIAGSHSVARNVAGYNAAGADNRVVTDVDTRTNDGASSKPDVLSDDDWRGGL